jgi:hypothetical protein
MENKTFNDYSTQNYDNLLIGWASRPVKPNLISFEQLDAQAHQQMQLQYYIKSKFLDNNRRGI